MKSRDELVEELSPDLQHEVQASARFLLETKVRSKQSKLRMSWAGGLSEFRHQFSSLALQNKALEWRGD